MGALLEVAALCYKSCGVEAEGHLSPSVYRPFSFPLVDSPGGLGRARLPAAKHYDANYTVKQLY